MKKYITILALPFLMSGCKTMKTDSIQTKSNNNIMSANEPSFSNLKYLEEITGDQALKFAHDNNKISDQRLKTDPRFQTTYDDIFKILSAQDKLPNFYIMAGEIYNLWQDDVHAKGLFRKSTIPSFNTGKPSWTTILDVDKLAEDEKIGWVFRGIQCLEPDYEHCLVSMSDGGKDAGVLREFNLKTKTFVDGGFAVAESKSHATWLDKDTILVGDATNPKTLTNSGYPSQIKLLKRGQKLEIAEVIFSCNPNFFFLRSEFFLDR